MPNRNILKTNIRTINRLVADFDKGEKTRDDLLKAYDKAVKQIPDHYNKEFNNRKVLPTAIAARSNWLHDAVKHQDIKMLHINAKEYMEQLEESHKYGNWTLYDYDEDKPLDSSPEHCRSIIITYQNGMQQELALISAREREEENEEPEL